jgi:hypothetical protein
MAKQNNKTDSSNTDFPNGHLTDVQTSYVLPAQIIDLEKHNGLMGDEVAPGFRKIIKNCPMPDGGVNLVLDHVGGKHQHWQKFFDPETNTGYWQNVEGQIQGHRKSNPIGVLVGTHKVDPQTGNVVKIDQPKTSSGLVRTEGEDN